MFVDVSNQSLPSKKQGLPALAGLLARIQHASPARTGASLRGDIFLEICGTCSKPRRAEGARNPAQPEDGHEEQRGATSQVSLRPRKKTSGRPRVSPTWVSAVCRIAGNHPVELSHAQRAQALLKHAQLDSECQTMFGADWAISRLFRKGAYQETDCAALTLPRIPNTPNAGNSFLGKA